MWRILFLVALTFALHAWWVVPSDVRAQENSTDRLSLTIAPSVLLADSADKPVIYVQLMGSDGVPKLAARDIEASLISSDARAVRVPEQVIIPAGHSYTMASLTTTSVPGNAMVTAVGSGLDSVSAAVETVNALGATPPFRLELYASPGNTLRGGRPPGKLSIVLLGANGRPASASEDMEVLLSSSNPDVVRIQDRVTISKGAHFATTDLVSLAVGSATLSSVSSGFVSRFIQVNVVEPGEEAEALALYLSPPVLRSGTGSLPGVIVQAIDDEGKPVLFPCTQVDLASSFPLSVEVSQVAEFSCDGEAQYVTGTLTPGNLPGTPIITAAATGLRPATANLAVHGQVPAELRAYLAPTGLLEVEATPGFLVIQVLDESGVPVISQDDIPIMLIGGEGILPDEVVIPGGRSFVRLALGDLPSGKETQLFLVNPSLSSTQLTVKSHALPIAVEVRAPETPLLPGDRKEVLVLVQSGGSPLAQAGLIWTVTGGTLSDATPVTDGNGEGRAVFVAVEPGDGMVQVAVTKAGYQEASTQADIAVVAASETGSSSPKLFGIPVWILFVILFLALLGYLGYRFYPTIKRRWT
ncbi:MAG: hypothetical protein V3U26_02630 [Dehalococcoidia bacterium]